MKNVKANTSSVVVHANNGKNFPACGGRVNPQKPFMLTDDSVTCGKTKCVEHQPKLSLPNAADIRKAEEILAVLAEGIVSEKSSEYAISASIDGQTLSTTIPAESYSDAIDKFRRALHVEVKEVVTVTRVVEL